MMLIGTKEKIEEIKSYIPQDKICIYDWLCEDTEMRCEECYKLKLEDIDTLEYFDYY